MLEQDYLMRIFLQFAEILRRSWFKARDEHDPKAAADMLEAAVGDAVDIDGATLLSLAPESMAGILQVSGTDPRVPEYVARSPPSSTSPRPTIRVRPPSRRRSARASDAGPSPARQAPRGPARVLAASALRAPRAGCRQHPRNPFEP